MAKKIKIELKQNTLQANPTEAVTQPLTKLKVRGINYSIGAGVSDVKVDGESVVQGGVADIDSTDTAHANDTAIHTSATEKATWNAKSTVSVSATGTATDEISYITVNGVEKKIASGEGTTDYEDLSNKPTINNVELSGNKSIADLSSENDYDSDTLDITIEEI